MDEIKVFDKDLLLCMMENPANINEMKRENINGYRQILFTC